LTETRHNDHYDVCVRLSTPAGYAARRRCAWSYVWPWRRRRRRHLPPASQVLASVAASMPRRENDLGAAHYHWVVIMNVYRPPSSSDRPSSLFFNELTTLLEMLVIHSCPVVVGGDFNISVQDDNSRRLSSLLASFDMVQHVNHATHRCGNALDRSGCDACSADRSPAVVTVQPLGIIADHSLIMSQLPVKTDSPSKRLVRGWRRVDRDDLRRALQVSPLCAPVPADADVDELFDTYSTVMLHHIADQLAPSTLFVDVRAVQRRGLTLSAQFSVATAVD